MSYVALMCGHLETPDSNMGTEKRRKKNGTNKKAGEGMQKSCSKKKRKMSQRKRSCRGKPGKIAKER